MDSINIIQPSAFIFFILVITIGYILVEIFGGENYIFRDAIKRYTGSNTMDRIIHYVSIGILFHFFILILFTLTGTGEFLDKIFSSGYQFAQDLHFTDGASHFDARLNAQLIVSSLLYFVMILIGMVLIRFGMWIWGRVGSSSIKTNQKITKNVQTLRKPKPLTTKKKV